MVLDEENRKAVREILSEMEGEVKLLLFTGDCEACGIAEELIGEISGLGKVQVETHGLDSGRAKELGVENVPTFVFEGRPNIRFVGLPSGHEFRTFLDTLIMVSKGESGLKDELRKELAGISEPIDIKIFVTPTCPYCPVAVLTAHRFALENKGITSSMVEATEFPEMSQKYGVMAVPKVVINEKVSFEGAVPEHVFLKKLKEAL